MVTLYYFPLRFFHLCFLNNHFLVHFTSFINFSKQMGNICCTEKSSSKSLHCIVAARQKSLTDPQTKKEYEKTLESILNQALEKFKEKYKINSLKLQGLVGKGGQAAVFQVDVQCEQDEHKIVKKLAMKRVSKKSIKKEHVRESLLLQKQILTSHPSCFVTQIEFACQDDSYIYFFMKLAVGGDCYPFVRDQLSYSLSSNGDLNNQQQKAKQFQKLGQQGIIFILAGVILGLESLHSLNVIYRDLKPENILVFQDGYPKLADFGVATKFNEDDDLYFDMKGTILYFAPQIVRKKGYDRAIDFWALGVLAYQLTFKQPPFSTSHINSKFFQAKANERLTKNLWPYENASNSIKDFINKLLIVDPTKRLGYASFNQIKQHPLFWKINWSKLQCRLLPSPLINIISKWPLEVKREAEINEIVQQQNHGHLPFTFVRNTNDTQRRTVEIIPTTFIIDDQMNIKWDNDCLMGKEKE